MKKSEYDKFKKESHLKDAKRNQSLFEQPNIVLNILYKNYQDSKNKQIKNSGKSTIF